MAASVCFVVQLYSSLYAGMYFVVPLVVILPASLLKAHAEGREIKRLVFRMGVATLALLPLLWFLTFSYSHTRRELGQENSYRHVSAWFRKGTENYMKIPSPACQLRVFGVRRSEAECRGEMFPGWLLVSACAVGVLFGGVRTARRLLRDSSRDTVARLLLPAVGLGLAFLIRRSFPFHVGLWLALVWPIRRPARALAVRSPGAVYAAAALLVADVSVNPVIQVFGQTIRSVYYFFFMTVPGFEGLRSEYRIVVLLPVFLALPAALSIRRVTAWARARGRRRLGTAMLVVCGLWATFDGQPRWQDYAPAPRTDQKAPVLSSAAALPIDAVLFFVKGAGETIGPPLDPDSARWNAYIISHRHRQLTSKSSYMTPASQAIGHALVGIEDNAERLKWTMRLAHVLGATHMIIDWVMEPSPDKTRIAAMLGPNVSLLLSDEHMALIEMAAPPSTAHGPVPSPGPPGERLESPLVIDDNFGARDMKAATDRNPRTGMRGPGAQRTGDAVTIQMNGPTCIAGVGLSPGLAIERLPTRYALDVDMGSHWETVYEPQAWEVQQNLIDHPATGFAVIRFDPVKARSARLRLTADSPFPLALSEFEIYRGSCQDVR